MTLGWTPRATLTPCHPTSSTWPSRNLARTSSSQVTMAWETSSRWRKWSGARSGSFTSSAPRSCASPTSARRNCKFCWEMSGGSTSGLTLPLQRGSVNPDVDPPDISQQNLQFRRALVGDAQLRGAEDVNDPLRAPDHFLHRDDVSQAIVTWDDEVLAKFREGHVDDVGWQGVKVALGVQPKVIRPC